MQNRLKFTNKTPQEILELNKNGVLNFQNLYSVYLFNNEPIFKKAITSPNNFIFPDGKILSFFLKTKQIRGPTFTRDFFQNKLNSKQKHFFIGLSKDDLAVLIKKFSKLKGAESYNPPYIKEIVFSKKEIEKIIKQLKKFKPDFIWVCIGNPKQEILANQLYKKYPAIFFNIGVAMDFLLNKKKEAPRIFRKIGLEWFYRLITDFKYSRRKVWRSLIAIKYLNKVNIK